MKNLLTAAMMMSSILCVADDILFELKITPEEIAAIDRFNNMKVEKDGDEQVLYMKGNGVRGLRLPENLKLWSNRKVTIRYSYKLKGVPKPDKDWNGFKVMCVHNSGGKNYQGHAVTPYGTCDWTDASYQYQFRDNPSNGMLYISIPGGEAWVANLVIIYDDLNSGVGKEAGLEDFLPPQPTAGELKAASIRELKEPVTLEAGGDWEINAVAKLANGKILSANFIVPRVEPQTIVHEKHMYFPVYTVSTGKIWWTDGTSPKASTFRSIVPGSIKVTSGTGPDAITYREGVDYAASIEWNRIGKTKNSHIERPPVYISYQTMPQRMDSVVLVDDRLEYRTGVAASRLPRQPELKRNEVRIANIYIPAGEHKLGEGNFYPITETCYPVTAVPVADRLLPKTMKKLRSGEEVRILAWGDSITNYSEPDQDVVRWQNQFVKQLKQRFPLARIELITEAWGGNNMNSYLGPDALGPGQAHNFKENILDRRPDLVISEFYNDTGIGNRKEFEFLYRTAAKSFAEIGAEWIIMAPNAIFTQSLDAGAQKGFTRYPGNYYKFLFEFSKEKDIPVADSCAIWLRLWRQGIPYLTLMSNHFNHPVYDGMKILADSTIALFPEK